ncbi:MAG: efflux RND transporter permease subunit [Bacteroidetes bacterium]|nr:efflux RND transporter permease subunit [Bacteroidota bacterium]MDA0922323.1 efflux RND transporter permease subunit [Bacteroidota bacterium]MDA1288305.1 efflux RND transporter permease subunit [Bacteroidota bacterium]
MKTQNSKEFLPSSWAIEHRTVIYVIMVIFFVLGLRSYVTMPRETFPEINDTKVFVSTVYPGNTAEDIERAITDPLEEALKAVPNLVEIKSTSSEDFSVIEVEFDENISIDDAKQKAKDLVDGVTSGPDWPVFNNAKVEPNVFELDFSELRPILNINMHGDYPIEQLKAYAELLKARVEQLPEIKEVNIRGIQVFEVEVAVDIYKMTAAQVSFNDIINAISRENTTISGGNVVLGGQRRNIRLTGEIEDPEDLANFVVKTEKGPVYLGDLADISFQEKEKTSFARSFGEKAVLLDVVKRGGKNLVQASQEIKEIVSNLQEIGLPDDLDIEVSNDQSNMTLNQISELVNSIIFGVILVVSVLMFFLGFRNALFVGFAIPMSMFMSFMILSFLGYTLNTMVLFGLVMGLGMLVDNGIVVVENVYRLMEKEGLSRWEAAKTGIGEIAFPIIISTATTIAAFLPLGAWPGLMGEFMIYFPITLSVVLGSSLVVAIFFNSMLVSQFMEISKREISLKSLWRLTFALGGLGILLLLMGERTRLLGNILLVIPTLFWLYKYFIKKWAVSFQNTILVRLENGYRKFLSYALGGAKPFLFLGGTFVLLFLSFALMGIFPPKVEFFPNNEPQQIFVFIEYPEGTAINKTNATTREIEREILSVMEHTEFTQNGESLLVESMVAQVGEGAGNPFIDNGNTNELPHKGKITLTMREYKFRNSVSSELLREEIQRQLSGKFPGVAISVEKDAKGPPAGYPITIEIKGGGYLDMIQTAEAMKEFLNRTNVAGVEELKIDVNKNKPGTQLQVDRQKAGELGVSASQVGQLLRTSLFGAKAGIFKKEGDDYDINVRFNKEQRYDANALYNQNIIFRDQATGRIKQIPIAALIEKENTTSFNAIKHKQLNRVVTLYSSVLAGYNANAVVDQVKTTLANYEMPDGMSYSFTGEIEEQEKNMAFLSNALAAALGLILLLLVFQFNSISKPLIILLSIFLSFTGVFLGLILFQMPFVILMTMMGIIALAGIVVNNGVVLLDYTQLLIDRKSHMEKVPEGKMLSMELAKEAIVEGGTARLRPVILTAITTVLGLIPLAIGLNIDFFTLFSEYDPNIYVGGDNVIFWGPLAWTVIFGLTFATFLTLVIVPATFSIVYSLKLWFKRLS